MRGMFLLDLGMGGFEFEPKCFSRFEKSLPSNPFTRFVLSPAAIASSPPISWICVMSSSTFLYLYFSTTTVIESIVAEKEDPLPP